MNVSPHTMPYIRRNVETKLSERVLPRRLSHEQIDRAKEEDSSGSSYVVFFFTDSERYWREEKQHIGDGGLNIKTTNMYIMKTGPSRDQETRTVSLYLDAMFLDSVLVRGLPHRQQVNRGSKEPLTHHKMDSAYRATRIPSQGDVQ